MKRRRDFYAEHPSVDGNQLFSVEKQNGLIISVTEILKWHICKYF
uniref:Uncharacterized protein n=1 Tax=Anguilla anguilla TaxID=7936 RepID=A0A0E9V2F1_ANGAN